MNETIDKLIKRKESKLKINVLEVVFDPMENLHLLCKKETDGSYVVWTAYNTNDEKTKYENFYHGLHDLSLKEAINEFTKRAKFLG